MTVNRFDLTGRVVVVTGAARGLCRAAALAYAECGAKVACVDRLAEHCEATAQAIRSSGGDAIAVTCDVSDRSACERMVRAVVSKYAKIDIALVGVGIAFMHDAKDATQEAWIATINANLLGHAYTSQAIGRQMIAQKTGGSIVLVSSSASTTALKQLVAYNASKGGVNMLARTLAIEWAEYGIRVNAIAPGYMDNVMLGTPDERANERVLKEINELTPMGRAGTLEEFCGPVIFLSSDAASFVTGHILFADGGYTAQ